MAYQKLTDLAADTVVALGNGEGQQKSIEGYYLGARQVTTSNGPSNIHVFQTPKGNVGVWGTKKLNDNLGNSNRGVMTLVNYKTKVKLQGGKTQHTYDFMVDPDNKIEVSQLAEGFSPVVAEEEYGGVDDLEAAEIAFQAASATKQTNVQQLLNKKR